jgi:hypothetical protein
MAEPTFVGLLREALAADRVSQSKWRVFAAALVLFYVTYAAFMANIDYVRSIVIGDLPRDSQDSLLDGKALRGRLLDASDIKDRQTLREKTLDYIRKTLDRIKTYAFPLEYKAEQEVKEREAAHEATRKKALREREAARIAAEMVRGITESR